MDAIDENSGAGQVIYTVVADDSTADVNNGSLSYSLSGDDADLLEITDSGDVILSANPNHESKSEYSFHSYCFRWY